MLVDCVSRCGKMHFFRGVVQLGWGAAFGTLRPEVPVLSPRPFDAVPASRRGGQAACSWQGRLPCRGIGRRPKPRLLYGEASPGEVCAPHIHRRRATCIASTSFARAASGRPDFLLCIERLRLEYLSRWIAPERTRSIFRAQHDSIRIDRSRHVPPETGPERPLISLTDPLRRDKISVGSTACQGMFPGFKKNQHG